MAIFKRKSAAVVPSTEETDKKPVATGEKKAPKAKVEMKKTEGIIAKTFSAVAVKNALTPLVTEKSAHQADSGVYAFCVPAASNRVEIREAFRELYKVTPLRVNILRVHGKEQRFGRSFSRESDWKKALITVPSGTRIDVFTL